MLPRASPTRWLCHYDWTKNRGQVRGSGLATVFHSSVLIGKYGPKDFIDVDQSSNGGSGLDLFLKEMFCLEEALGLLQNHRGLVLRHNNHPIPVGNYDVARGDSHSSTLDQDVNVTVT